MTLIELVLIWAMGHTTGIGLMMLCVWIAEKTGHRADWYLNSEDIEDEDY